MPCPAIDVAGVRDLIRTGVEGIGHADAHGGTVLLAGHVALAVDSLPPFTVAPAGV